MQNDRSIRIRTAVGVDAPQVINVALGQTYDTLEILSLKLRQENLYKLFNSDYGVIVGRVLASGNFGVPNAKVSVFIAVEENETTLRKILYGYETISSQDEDGIRYNLLPDEAINACYQNVGTFPNKRFLLDNTDVIETFDKYWKYTTVTNDAGDYMLFGIPTGQQIIHVDIDLSDIGVLSQRPRDMIYQGFNINQFESPNKFKQSTDLNSLAQIKTQDKSVNVFPYWGDTTMDDGATIGITRCDIQIQYEFQPTCIFIGSIITDKASNAIGKNCGGSERVGNMSELGTGEGSIEMIRKTYDGKIEEFQIRGNRLIDGDGVWCYQIPMNLDYVMTDEFGNTVPTDDPTKGIPTRTRVRFRISLDETPTDMPAKKRARYLVPNNPRINSDYPEFSKKLSKGMGNDSIDYEFGSATLDEDFRDLMWNNVYTVKNYIPRIQSRNKARNKKNTAIKKVNFAGDNNPMPYNNLYVRLGLRYSIICIVIKVFITLVGTLNSLIIGYLNTLLNINIIGRVLKLAGVNIHCIPLSGNFCDSDEKKVFFPGCPGNPDGFSLINVTDETNNWVQRQNANALYYQCIEEGGTKSQCSAEAKKKYGKFDKYKNPDKVVLEEGSQASFDEAELFNCIEQQLIEENESATFNFSNDWVNGVLYAPLWFRKIRPKKTFFFGTFTRKAKDKYCSTDRDIKNRIKVHQSGASYRSSINEAYTNEYNKTVTPYATIPNMDEKLDCGDDCQKEYVITNKLNHGIIKRKETMRSSDAYYYAPIEYQNIKKNTLRETAYNSIDGDVILLYATDIVLLGSLNDCDQYGIPQFFKVLEPTTYQLPPALLSRDEEPDMEWDSGKKMMMEKNTDASPTDMTGCDWGNANKYDQYYQVKRKWSGLMNYLRVVTTDGGLFYGVNCTSVDTVGKTNINVLRVCELGVSLDETEEIEDLAKMKNSEGEEILDNLTADGYISKDELYDLDSRASFATMNYNNLRTVFDEEKGIYKYDFRYLYPENFDGAMSSYMKDYMTDYKKGKDKKTMDKFKPENGKYVSYRYNYLLEKFNRDYYRFRMGKAPYFYDNEVNKDGRKWQRFPRYENSYYFYFGLKNGKTAIEKFNSQFFGTCENNSEPVFTSKIDYDANTWCTDGKVGQMDGYIAIDVTNIITPYSISIVNKYNDAYSIEKFNIEDEKIIIPNKGCSTATINEFTNEGYVVYNPEKEIINGIYNIEIIDGAGNTTINSIKFNQTYLSYSTEDTIPFKVAFNIILKEFNNNYAAIANDENPSVPERKIGGVICLSDLVNYNERINWTNNIMVKVTSNNEIDRHQWTVTIKNGDLINAPYGGKIAIVDGKLYITVPCGDEIYTVEVIELCNGAESNNKTITEVTVGQPKPLKMYVNDVDVDLFKTDGSWEINEYAVGDAWFDMRTSQYYNWEADSEYQNTPDELKDDYKENIYDLVEGGFVMTQYGEKEISIRVEGEDANFPVIYTIQAQDEGSEDFNMERYNNIFYYIATANRVEHNDSLIRVGIPNITSDESFLWKGGEKVINNKYQSARWAKDNNVVDDKGKETTMGNNRRKMEYLCSAKTADETLLPEADNAGNVIPFKAIIIDKILDTEIIAWAAPVEFPHYGIEEVNKYITMSGFVTGKVTNGLATQMDTTSRKFERQYLEGNELLLTYHNSTEKSYPIFSYIDGGDDLFNLKVYPENSDSKQYASLSAMKETLEITDKYSNGITKDLYGNTKIMLNSESINSDKKVVLNVYTNTDKGNTKFYLFEYSGDKHPYDTIENNVTISDAWQNNGVRDYNMFSFQTKSSDLFDLASKTQKWWGTFTDNNDKLTKEATSNGYKNKHISNGYYYMDKKTDGKYIVISEDSEGTRAVSPVYDFSEITVDAFILISSEDKTIDITASGNVPSSSSGTAGGGGSSDDGTTTGGTTSNGQITVNGTADTTLSTYYLGFKVTDNEKTPYYPKYYDYTMYGTINNISAGSSILNALKKVENTNEVDRTDYLLVPTDYNTIQNVIVTDDEGNIKIKEGSTSNMVVNTNNSSLYVSDVTGLKHQCKFTDGLGLKVIVPSNNTEPTS